MTYKALGFAVNTPHIISGFRPFWPQRTNWNYETIHLAACGDDEVMMSRILNAITIPF